MHHSDYHTATPGMRTAAQVALAAAPRKTRARRLWRAASVCVACALLLLPAAPARASGGAATRGRRRHGRDAEPGAGLPRGNQTATVAPPQEQQESPAAGTLQARAQTWLANQTLALATHGPVSAWDTSGETDLARVFQGAAAFNEDLNTYAFGARGFAWWWFPR